MTDAHEVTRAPSTTERPDRVDARTLLADLPGNGRAAAVVRENIQAHLRFAAARDGEIVFDDDSIDILDAEDPDDVSRFPEELQPLFAARGEDLGFPTALAMAELVTGVRLTADDLRAAHAAGYRPAPSMRYAEGLDDEA